MKNYANLNYWISERGFSEIEAQQKVNHFIERQKEGRPEKDIIRDKYLQEKGYKILRITEYEYQKYPKETIQKCLQFLKA